MLTALRQRLVRDKEEGFTLIELMVVVLIIGILLAIAIPTFLGARAKAQNRSAQSNLRNTLTAEKTIYVDAQAYTDTPAALTAVEPALTFAQGNTAPAVVGTVQLYVVNAGTTSDIYLAAKSASGTCYYIHDNSTSATQYAADSTCAKTPSTAAYAATAGFP